MAVPEQTPYKEYTGNGTTTSFPLEFDCEEKSHLIVTLDGIEPDYFIWSLGVGNVVFSTPPSNGTKVVIQRNTPFERNTDYQSYNNSFRPQAVNKELDRIWLKLQELGVADWLLRLYVDRLHSEQKTYIDLEDGQLHENINNLSLRVDNQDDQLQQNIDNLKEYVDDKDDELRSYLMEEIRKQGVALDQLDDYYNYLMQRLAQIAVDKGWDASFVVDGSGKTQQEVNDSQFKNLALSVKTAEQDNILPALQRIIDSMSDGETLYIPKCPWGQYSLNGQLKITNKNINIICNDVINVTPSTTPNFLFERTDYVDVAGGTLSVSPKKGDTKLNFTTPPMLVHPSDYFVVFVSTEDAIRRLEPDSFYKKLHTADITTSDYILRDGIPYDYTDLSKLTLRFVKKGTPVSVHLRLKPNVQPVAQTNYIEFRYTSNINQFENTIDAKGLQYSGQHSAYNYTLNMNVERSIIVGANATDSDSYAFVQFCSSYLSLNKCSYYDSDNTAKRSRGITGRHGFHVSIDNCLFAGVDDHWGHDYYIRNMNMTRGVGITGGSVTIENCSATDALFSQRVDTPYNDGKLTIRNSSTAGQLIVAQRITTPSKFTKRKFFDVVDVDADVYVKSTGNPVIQLTDGWNEDEQFHDTIGDISLRVFQENGKARNILVQGRSPFTSDQLDLEVFRLFKKLNIKVNHMFTDNSLTDQNLIGFYGLCASELNINMNDFSGDLVRANELTLRGTFGIKNPSASNCRLLSDKINLNQFNFKSNAQGVIYVNITPKVSVRFCNFETFAQAEGLNWSVIESAYGNTITEIAKPNYSTNRNWSNYDKQNQTRYVFASDLVIPANGVSATFTVAMPRYTPSDFLFAQMEIWDSTTRVETFDNGNVAGTINFVIRNLTGASVTVPSGRAVAFKII